MTEEDVWRRFFERLGPRNECWPWHGSKIKKDGRGVMSIDNRNVTAPRIAWRVFHGEWPASGLFVCHTCDNPNCINPHHLWLGSNQENILDASRKGRLNGQSKTHCKRGHPFNEENTIVVRGTARSCRMCQRMHQSKYDRKRRARAALSTEGE